MGKETALVGGKETFCPLQVGMRKSLVKTFLSNLDGKRNHLGGRKRNILPTSGGHAKIFGENFSLRPTQSRIVEDLSGQYQTEQMKAEVTVYRIKKNTRHDTKRQLVETEKSTFFIRESLPVL